SRAARSPCANETMKPTSESLSLPVMRTRQVAEGNCEGAIRRGEQSEAKDQSQTVLPMTVNSFRRESEASRRTDRICQTLVWGVMAKPGFMIHLSGLAAHIKKALRATYRGWSENGLKASWVKLGSPRLSGTSGEGRALIVALKRVMTVEPRRVGR